MSKGSEIAFTSADISDVRETILREEIIKKIDGKKSLLYSTLARCFSFLTNMVYFAAPVSCFECRCGPRRAAGRVRRKGQVLEMSTRAYFRL